MVNHSDIIIATATALTAASISVGIERFVSPRMKVDELIASGELGTPAKIYYKWEGVSPAGSHKPNTAIAQAYYNKQEGVKRITTETGAGQWGSALSLACNFFDIECKVYMVRISYDQKPYRRLMMQAWGGKCVASPSNETQAGRNVLAEFPDTPGSLGIAISEAVEAAVTDPSGTTKYSLGSVLNHVMLHQTVIGLEAKKQLEKAGEKLPDVVIGCAGGGSNGGHECRRGTQDTGRIRAGEAGPGGDGGPGDGWVLAGVDGGVGRRRGRAPLRRREGDPGLPGGRGRDALPGERIGGDAKSGHHVPIHRSGHAPPRGKVENPSLLRRFRQPVAEQLHAGGRLGR